MKCIGFDVDGVLANFSQAFTTVAHQLYGLPIMQEHEIQHWNYHKWYCTREQEAKIWDKVRETPWFWTDIAALVPDTVFFKIAELQRTHRVYMISSRPDTGGVPSLEQTLQWFTSLAGFAPATMISSKKGKLCEALGVDYFIDDKFTNCIDIVKSSPRTRVHLLAKPHNLWVMGQFPSYFEPQHRSYPEIRLVWSVEDYLQLVQEAK